MRRSEVKTANLKVMIYVPPELHKEVKYKAIEAVTSVSDIYVKAALKFLRRGESTADEAPSAITDVRRQPKTLPMNDKAGAEVLRRLDRLDRDLNARFLGLYGPAEARGMAVALAAMFAAGQEGLPVSQITTIMDAEGVERGCARLALDALKQAGVARNQDRRWHCRAQATAVAGPDGLTKGNGE